MLFDVHRNGEWLHTKYIVCNKPAFVYFSVPKVACSSIKTALLPLFSIEDREAHPADRASGIHALFDHAGHQIGKAQLLEHRNYYRGHFRFAFVRNPWDRLLSCWSQKLAPGGQGLGRERYNGERLWVGMSFPEFVNAVCHIPDRNADPHFRSQHTVVCGNGPRKRVLANFVGRYERLEEDFSKVAERLGADLRLPRLLVSERPRSYQDAYDDQLAHRVGERYQRDAEIFGYSS